MTSVLWVIRLSALSVGDERISRQPTREFVRIMSLFNTSRLLNKTVLITGASSGIGAVSPRNGLSHFPAFLIT